MFLLIGSHGERVGVCGGCVIDNAEGLRVGAGVPDCDMRVCWVGEGDVLSRTDAEGGFYKVEDCWRFGVACEG